MNRALTFAGLLFAAATLCVACADDTLTVQPVSVCRCNPDEICVGNQCVPVNDAQVLPPDQTEPTTCDPRAVLINELRYAGQSRPDFIELRGPAGTRLEGYRVRGYDLQNTNRLDVELFGEISETGLWVGAFGDSLEAEPDAVLGLTGFPASPGSVVLHDCEQRPLDALAYGEAPPEVVARGEGEAAGETGPDQSLARCPGDFDTIDTNDNSADFLVDAASPGEPNTRVEGTRRCITCDVSALDGQVWLGEVLYDPSGADDQAAAYIEVRGVPNTDLGEVAVELWDEVKALWVPVGSLSGRINANGFHLIGEDETIAGAATILEDIDGANFAGGVRLVTCDVFVLDAVVYGAVADLAKAGVGEAADDVPDGSALARCPDGATLAEVGAFTPSAPSPGALNTCP